LTTDTAAAAGHLPAKNSFSLGFLRRPQRFEHRVDAHETLFIIVSVHATVGLFVVGLRALGLSPTVLGVPGFLKFSKAFS
jgi:hypothetical protein